MKYQKLYNLLIWKFIKNLVKIVEDEIMKLIIKKKKITGYLQNQIVEHVMDSYG